MRLIDVYSKNVWIRHAKLFGRDAVSLPIKDEFLGVLRQFFSNFVAQSTDVET